MIILQKILLFNKIKCNNLLNNNNLWIKEMVGEDNHQHQVNRKKLIWFRVQMKIFKTFQISKKLIFFKIKILLTKDKTSKKTNFWIKRFLHLSNQLKNRKNKIFYLKSNKIKTKLKQSKVRVFHEEQRLSYRNLNKVSKINKIYVHRFLKKLLRN